MSILKRIFFVILALLLLIAGVLYLILNNGNETMTYKQNDFIHYHMLTDKDIANAPGVTHDFYFEPSPEEGYPPTSSIIFKKAI